MLTLFSGENELSDCEAALKSQTHTRWEHKIFRHLGNVEAHQTLYHCIMDAANEFDLFVKLDADMVFTRRESLADLVAEFEANQNMDHAVFAVHDWATDRPTMGLHAFSNRVNWPANDESLFVDPRPQIPGERRLYWETPAPIATHMHDPTAEQAWLFGYHRALKIVQRGRLRKNIEQAETQWAVLENVWEAYKSAGDPRRAAVLLGAEAAFTSRARVLEDKSSVSPTFGRDALRDRPSDEASRWLANRWEPGSWRNRWRHWRRVQLPRRLMAMARRFRTSMF